MCYLREKYINIYVCIHKNEKEKNIEYREKKYRENMLVKIP